MTGIPPKLVTIGSHTPATQATIPNREALSEDVTQVEVEARPPSPVPTSEEEVEESGNNNQLGETHVADIQHNGIKVPFHCTDAITSEHLTNHFNDHLNDKIYNTFKDLFCHINIDSIQEIYLKISIYKNIIAQFVEETNCKYGLDLKFTILEAPEVVLWAKKNSGCRPPQGQTSV